MLAALFTPLLAEKENAAIANISSELAFMADMAFGMPVYTATKAGLHNFSIAQRKQLAPLGIRVIEIIPPAVESELNPEGRRKRDQTRSPYFMSSEEFVEKALARMAQDENEIRIEQSR
jgi:uncharacterized oxidoreductase